MSIERKILAAAAKSRAAYETIAVSTSDEDVGAMYAPLMAGIRAYYEADSAAQCVDTGLLTERLAGTVAGDKRVKAMRTLCEEVWAEDVSPANVAEYVREHALETSAMRVASAVAARKGRAEVDRLVRAYTDLLDAPTIEAERDELDWGTVLRKRLDKSNRIKVSPPCLNERLGGGVFPGTNITIFARPECGKSAFALTMACGFARRGVKGLILGNEDPVATYMVRCACNLTGMTEEEMSKDPAGAERIAIQKGAGNLVFRDMSPGTPKEIEQHVRKHRPQFVVIDQIRNINIKDAEGGAAKLDRAAQSVRDIGKKYGCVTIGVTQAGDSASDKLVLKDSDIDSSKTGIPGAADVLIGIGVNDNLEQVGQRMINLPKNKVSARHEFWNVGIDSFRSKYFTLK